MAESNGEFPTVLGSDARFNGELSFDKGVRIEGTFEGRIKSKGTLAVAEGAKIIADVEAANVRLEGEIKGNVIVSEKLQLMSTAKLEGDLRATRLEIADGAIFIGNVTVGQAATAGSDSGARRAAEGPAAVSRPQTAHPRPAAQPMPHAAAAS